MAISNLATGRPVDGWGAGPTLALPGFAFGVMTVLTLYAPTLLWLSPGSAAAPFGIDRLQPWLKGISQIDR